MGCDIHLFVERKNADGEWVGEHVRYPDVKRNYGGFAALAPCGRGSWECTPQMRNLPPDASDEARRSYEEWGCDAHTPSYLYKNELDDILDFFLNKIRDREGDLIAVHAQSFVLNILQQMKNHDAERIVFWFDN